MTPLISIVIASKNEHPGELDATIQSIRDTGGTFPTVGIVVVDDLSTDYVECADTDVVVIHNPTHLGCGGSRHVGVLTATAPLILITDPHVRFMPGWLKPTLVALEGRENLLLCGECRRLNPPKPDPRKPKPREIYTGAELIIHEPAAEPRYRILNARWAKDKPGKDNYPLSAVMGACYAMHKSWFLKIGGLKFLRGWGLDESALSLKTLIAGGEIRMFKSLKIAHKFRAEPDRLPFRVDPVDFLSNCIALAHICCSPRTATTLTHSLGQDHATARATGAVIERQAEIVQERNALNQVAKRSWNEVASIIAQINQTL